MIRFIDDDDEEQRKNRHKLTRIEEDVQSTL